MVFLSFHICLQDISVRCCLFAVRTSQKLKVQNETSNIADDVMGRLFGQREALESSQQRVRTRPVLEERYASLVGGERRKTCRRNVCLIR